MSWLDRNEVLQPAQPPDQWPRNCQFNSAEVDDPSLADLLLLKDTACKTHNVSAQQVIYLIVDGRGNLQSYVSINLEEDIDIWRSLVPTAKSVVVITHYRRQHGERSIATINIPWPRWFNLIQNLALPPSALELLHDNNGGSASRFSSCSSGCVSSCDKPCAYHVWLRPSDWVDDEHYIYARHDFHTNQKVVFCASTESHALADKLATRFEQCPSPTLFHILYTCLSFCFYSIENARWYADNRILELETSTGYSHWVGKKAKQVTLNELTLTKDVAWARNTVYELNKAASVLEDIHLFTEAQLHRFVKYDDTIADHDRNMPHGAMTMLSDSFLARISQIKAQILQMQGLNARTETQFNMITAMVSQRDNQINIKIATATQADSQLMKGIASVTMVFLPATFFATFFSMIFFELNPSNDTTGGNTGSSNFSASKWIWVYFVCTVPLTLLLTWEYGLKKTSKEYWEKWRSRQSELWTSLHKKT